MCEAQRSSNVDIRCASDGLFEPVQCNRLPGETENTRLTALDCYCVHPMTGVMLSNTMRHVTNRKGLLDCYSHGTFLLEMHAVMFITIILYRNTKLYSQAW